MQFILPNSRPRWDKQAFTLVEMLVVIAIISILMTAGVIGLNGLGSKGVTSGVATAESIFEEARTTAIGKSLRVCVLVAKDLTNNHPEDLRRMIVAYEDVNADGTPKEPSSATPKWVLTGRGALLPDQTYFSAKFSKKDQVNGTGALEEVTDSVLRKAPTTGQTVAAPYQGTYLIYEFNAQGMPKYADGAGFIIGAGARNGSQSASAQPPRVMGSAKRDFGGFIIWRNGRTSVFRSPDQMGDAMKTINSGDSF